MENIKKIESESPFSRRRFEARHLSCQLQQESPISSKLIQVSLPFYSTKKSAAMAMQVAEDQRAGAEVYYSSETCKEKSMELLEMMGLSKGLLPLDESGYVKETGYVWLKQKKKIDHRCKKIGKTVSYAPEITAYVEKNKMKRLTGVKSKEILLWITIVEISIDESSPDKIYFKSSTGIGRSFPVSAFELDEGKD